MVKKRKENSVPWLVKAYKNIGFLNSRAARPIRILTELLEPADRLRKYGIRNTVVFFGSSRILPEKLARKKLKEIHRKIGKYTSLPRKFKKEYEIAQRVLKMSSYYRQAMELSRKLTLWFNQPLTRHNRFVVASGGGPGIMEAANLGAKKAKGRSIGLNISLPMEQWPNPHQTKEISFEFHYFFIRKFWFFYPAKALVIFPGGFGTFDELFELLTLIQTGKTKKYMPIVLFGSAYWNEVINFHAMLKWDMIDKKELKLFRIFDDVDEAFLYLKKELSKHYLKPYQHKGK